VRNLKKAALIFLAALTLFAIASCQKAGTPEAPEKAVSMYDLRAAMCAADPTLPEMLYASSSDSDPAKLFENISDVDYEKVESFFVAYAADGKAYEIAVVCAKDAADTSEIKTSLLRHVASRAETYRNYMPDQTKKAEDAEVFVSGRYAVLIMCDKKDEVRKAFGDFING
jgi:hypothetical protein